MTESTTRFVLRWYNGGLSVAREDDCRRVLAALAEYVETAAAPGSEIVTLRRMVESPKPGLGEWAEAFAQAVRCREAEIEHLDEEWAAGLVRYLSGRFPGSVFGARSVGFELDEVWVLWGWVAKS